MRRVHCIPILLATLFVTLSSSAQTVDLFVRAIEATKEGKTHVHGGVATVHLNSARGFEAGADVLWTPRVSTELSISSVNHDLDASALGESVDLGATRERAVTALLSYHTNSGGPFDVHFAGGASFINFEDISGTAELTLLGVRSIKFHDKAVPVADAGASFRLGPHWALTADAKWFDLQSKTTATYLDQTSEGADLNLEQVTLGVGLAFRF